MSANLVVGSGLRRRDFLRLGALAGAGLVVGFRVPAFDEAEAAEKPAARFQPNAWLRVGKDGKITVWIARSEMGQGVRTCLPMFVAEELEADWKDIRIEQAVPAPQYGDMSTGGSQSVRSSWKPLRQAGAAAREMLIGAAAATWGVDRATCRAERGAVVHAPSGRKLAYGALVEQAAKQPVPKDPPLKEAKDFRVLGTRRDRLDGPEKVDGSGKFGMDVRLPGLLVAVVERCPVFGGKLASFDPAPALAVKGVKRVEKIPSGVAVLADDFWAAQRGRERLRVTWDEGALAGLDSAAISRTYAELVLRPGPSVRKEGDGAAALERAARKLEAVYEAPYLAHATLEPMNCAAHVRADACEVWVGTQTANVVQQAAAEITGLPLEKVTVHVMLLGGGFGRRSEQDYVVEAVELSKLVGAPVKVVWTREDDMRHDFYRPSACNLLRAGLDAAGKPLVWSHRIVSPAILARLAPQAVQGGVDPTSLDCAQNVPYAFPHLEVEYTLHDAGVPVGWWRSVSASQNAYAVECFLDEVAAAAGRDPLEFRLALLEKSPRHRGVLQLAAEKAGWGKPLPRGRGRGIAVAESFGSWVAQVAEVSVGGDGGARVHRVVCAVDCGRTVNPALVEAQMESGIIFGLSAALKGEITLERGRVVQGNFDGYDVVRMNEAPEIEVHIVPSVEAYGGIGEVGLPPIAPAVANAVFAATGRPVRRLPIRAEDLKTG
jgi:isoquinoline 1-oxidoreductase beta subunit